MKARRGRDEPVGLPDVLIEESPRHLDSWAIQALVGTLGAIGIVGEPISEQECQRNEDWVLRLHWLGLDSDALGVSRVLGIAGTWASCYFAGAAGAPRAIRVFDSRDSELGTLALQDELPA